MMSYVYRNLNSYENIIKGVRTLLDFRILSNNDGCMFLSENVDVDINKKFTSIRVKDPAYNISEIKRIIVERK